MWEHLRRSVRFYDEHILPRLLHLAMQQDILTPYRQRVVRSARGRVLEIGAGSGVNLPLYSADASHVIAVEPSAPLLQRARVRADSTPRRTLIRGVAESLPFRAGSVDTVVVTWTLCSIADVAAALREMHRVLKPGGRLLFVEHGRAPEAGVQRWQDRLTPLWRRLAGGCHLNRAAAELVAAAGFRIDRLESGYMSGPKLFTYMYEGVAVRSDDGSSPEA
jgi:ubiquinone/menaquinone biosynthesis C-methylase UbiE